MSNDIHFDPAARGEDMENEFVQFYGTKHGQDLKFRITREALEALAVTPYESGRLLDQFDDMRERINNIARGKSDAVAGGHSGVILIRLEDI